ncbi:MFS transporter [Marisediminicola sp. LYQ134]|uniref:MFS transporter n=1 Tax=Marisediminicola sp. LYQ134 TaxID=3391061 RepID=UPI0039836B1B
MSSTATESRSRLRLLLIALCIALALVIAGNSALAIALPDVAADLDASQSDLTWIIDAYALAFAALLLPAGIAADRFGRRTTLTVGLIVFAAANILSGFSADPETFIVWRAVAGAGAAAVFPVTLSALVDAYPSERRAFAISVWSAVSGAGAVLGTLVAGALLEVQEWPSIQIVFGALAALLIVPTLVLVAENKRPGLSLDPWAAAWSVIGLAALVWAIIGTSALGITDPAVIAAYALAAGALTAFVVHELRTREPALDVRLFRSRGLTTGSLIVALQFFASLGFFVISPQYLQIVAEFSPLGAAVALLTVTVGVGGGTALAAAMIARVGATPPGALGLGVMGVGFILLAVVLGAGDANLWIAGIGVVLFGLGFGLAITPGTVLIIDGIPAERRSVASAVNDITREVGGVVGIAILGSVLAVGYAAHVETPAGVPAEVAEVIEESAGAGLAIAEQAPVGGEALAADIRSAFEEGTADAMRVAGIVTLGASVLVAVIGPRGRRREVGDSEPQRMSAQ